MRKKTLSHLQFPALSHIGRCLGRKSPVQQTPIVGHPFVFEGQKTLIIVIGAAQIEFQGPGIFWCREGFPEEPWSSAKFFERGVRATVLEVTDVTKSQCEYGSDRDCVLGRYPDFQCVPLSIQEILKPGVRRGRQMMSPPRQDE